MSFVQILVRFLALQKFAERERSGRGPDGCEHRGQVVRRLACASASEYSDLAARHSSCATTTERETLEGSRAPSWLDFVAKQ